MLRSFLFLIVLVFSLAGSLSAQLLPAAPVAELMADGSVMLLALEYRASTILPGATDFLGSVLLGDASVTVTGTWKPDPFHSFDLQVSNGTVDPIDIVFSLWSPVDSGPYTRAYSFAQTETDFPAVSVTGFLSEAFPDSVAPFLLGVPEAALTISIPSCGDDPCSDVSPLSSGVYDSGWIASRISFTAPQLAGTFASGYLEILDRGAVVPEPGAWALMATGFACLVAFRRIRS